MSERSALCSQTHETCRTPNACLDRNVCLKYDQWESGPRYYNEYGRRLSATDPLYEALFVHVDDYRELERKLAAATETHQQDTDSK